MSIGSEETCSECFTGLKDSWRLWNQSCHPYQHARLVLRDKENWRRERGRVCGDKEGGGETGGGREEGKGKRECGVASCFKVEGPAFFFFFLPHNEVTCLFSSAESGRQRDREEEGEGERHQE